MNISKGLALGLLSVTLFGCGKSDNKPESGQVAAKVDGKEISLLQLNQVIKNVPNVSEDNVDAIRKQILDRLIDQQLILNKAYDEKFERTPEVVSAIETAKRDAITRAYVSKLVATKVKPGNQEVKTYFETHPELFTQRRVYNLQDIAIAPGANLPEDLAAQVEKSKGMQDVAEWLKAGGVKFGASSYSKPAEQIATDALAVLKNLKGGEIVPLTMDGNVHVVKLIGAVPAPMDFNQAKPLILSYLTNTQGQQLIKQELARMKESAKIEYVGKFADGATSQKTEKPTDKPAEKNSSHIEKGIVGLD